MIPVTDQRFVPPTTPQLVTVVGPPMAERTEGKVGKIPPLSSLLQAFKDFQHANGSSR